MDKTMDPLDIDLDTTTTEILLHASNHDLDSLKPFLKVPGAASVQDPETGFTPLHAAISSCGEFGSSELHGDENINSQDHDIEAAKATIRELFLSGAIWNDLDINDETPGCLAWRLGRKELYELVVEAGVRAEMLMNLMGGYEEIDSDDESIPQEGEEDINTEEVLQEEIQQITPEQIAQIEAEINKNLNESITAANTSQDGGTRDVNSADYLASTLKFTPSTLLDSSNNGVMMDWETPIMSLTKDLLTPTQGLRILNVGFGMGIIDTLFASTNPSIHHIVEAHPDVLRVLEDDAHPFGPKWQSSTSASNIIHKGKWQDILPTLLTSNVQYDAIYFDTFGESYSQLKLFFDEYVVALLAPGGRFSFFNGLGADRKVCYDVYCRVVELDLCAAGFDVEWRNVEVEELGAEGEGEWKGVRRRYWVLDQYRLPIITFLG